MNEFYLLNFFLHIKKSDSYPLIFLKDEKIYDDDVLNGGHNYVHRICKNVPTEGLFFYHTDQLMTPLQMTDESAAIVWQAEYYPFGRIYSQSGDIENNLRFPGQYNDQNINLYYNLHRWYSAKTGRYIIEDKILEETSSYNYAINNPLIYFDFFGLYPCNCYDECPGGRWIIEDTYAGINAVTALGQITFNGKIHCSSLRPGEVMKSPLEKYPITIVCDFKGIDIEAGVGINWGVVTKKCNFNEITKDEWSGLYISAPILGGFISSSPTSGSGMYLGGTGFSFSAGLGGIDCRIKERTK